MIKINVQTPSNSMFLYVHKKPMNAFPCQQEYALQSDAVHIIAAL